MLIDDFLPNFEFHDASKADVSATPSAVFRAIKTFDMTESATIRWLFKMRGISINNLTIGDFEKVNFKVLGEKPDEEIVLGLAGDFKSLTGGLLDISAPDFRNFNKAGFIKAVWNFTVAPNAGGKSRVTTEIRIEPSDDASRAKIKTYWEMIKPPSQMIRKELLKLIKKQAERLTKEK